MTITVVLKKGLTIGQKTHTEVTLHEPSLADMMAAEDMAPAYKSVSYRVALLASCIVSIGTYSGAATMDIMGRLHPGDFNALSKALDEVEDEGKLEEPAV